jgi:hypothetical protein
MNLKRPNTFPTISRCSFINRDAVIAVASSLPTFTRPAEAKPMTHWH